jgi:rare lipoprotein A
MNRRLRKRSAPKFIALALVAFMTTGPAQLARAAESGPILPVEIAPLLQTDRIADIAESIADAEDPVLRDIYESIGQGEASYYGNELAGNRTASGERFNPHGLTAAHRSLPLGTKLRVTNLANGMSVIVRVNDRGPFVRSRIIDVSLGAARQIRMVGSGHAQVKLEILRTIA